MPYNNGFGNPFGYNGMNNMGVPQATPQNPFQQSEPSGIIQVVGLDGAKAYHAKNNTMIPLFDSNEAVFYIKTTDNYGNSNVRVFDFKERVQEEPKYITQDDLNNTMTNFMNQMMEVINAKPTVFTASTANTTFASEQSDEPDESAAPVRRRKR